MEIKSNWRNIVKKAWSMRFMALAAISNGVLVFVTLAPELLPKSWGIVAIMASLSVVFNGLAMWSRLIVQKGI